MNGEKRKSLGSSSGQLRVQCLGQSLFLTLAFHLHQVLGVLGSRVVDTALGLLLALPATRALVLVVGDGLGGMPVTDALVATVKELVVGDIVFLDVLLDLVEGPVGQGVDLDQASFVDLDDVQVTTLATLAAAAASEDGVDIQFTVSPLGRLDLGDPVVELVVDLPHAGAILGFEFGGGLGAGRLVDVNIVERVKLPHAVHQRQGLLEMVERVEEDEVDHLRPGHVQLRQHVQGDEAGQAKGSGLEEVGE